MANWLEKVKTSLVAAPPSANLPAARKRGEVGMPLGQQPLRPRKLPNASLIYGVASSVLFVVSFCFLLQGLWGTGLVVLLPALVLLGYALYFLKHGAE
jgi:hypothetical protein